MYVMCLCLFSALGRRVGALQIPIIIIITPAWLNKSNPPAWLNKSNPPAWLNKSNPPAWLNESNALAVL